MTFTHGKLYDERAALLNNTKRTAGWRTKHDDHSHLNSNNGNPIGDDKVQTDKNNELYSN